MKQAEMKRAEGRPGTAAASRIIVIRHGRTEGNAKRWFYGSTDLHLTDDGRREILQKMEEGVYPGIPEDAGFFTTGLARTDETLALICGIQDPVHIDELREMDFGVYECKTFSEIKDDPEFMYWSYDETGDVVLPGGESKNMFARRIMAGYEMLMEQHNARAAALAERGREAVDVLICHGGVIAGIMQTIFPGERKTMWDWVPEPGSGYIWIIKDGKPAGHVLIGEAAYSGEEDEAGGSGER